MASLLWLALGTALAGTKSLNRGSEASLVGEQADPGVQDPVDRIRPADEHADEDGQVREDPRLIEAFQQGRRASAAGHAVFWLSEGLGLVSGVFLLSGLIADVDPLSIPGGIGTTIALGGIVAAPALIHAGNLRSSRALNGLGHHRSLRPIFTGIALYSVGIALYGYAFSDILDGEYDERRFVLLSSTGGTLFMLSYLSTLKQHVVIGSAERRTASHFRADQRVVVVPVLSPHHTGLAFALAW